MMCFSFRRACQTKYARPTPTMPAEILQHARECRQGCNEWLLGNENIRITHAKLRLLVKQELGVLYPEES